jgi:hypothetical protein
MILIIFKQPSNRFYSALFSLVFALIGFESFAQQNVAPPAKDTVPRGVSVSPSSMRFAIQPGTSQSKQITVRNDTDYERTFQVLTNDYGIDDINRKSADAVVPENFKYGLTRWMYTTPNLFTLKPGEVQRINVLIDIPPGDENTHAAWNMVIIEEVKERQMLDIPSNVSAVGLGIVPTMGFGIYVYQNPPNMVASEISLTGLKANPKAKNLVFKTKNKGQAIGFCTYYLEIMNMATGKTVKILPKQITLLPTAEREFTIDFLDLPTGSYNALLVIDYGSKDYLETAEIDFAIP